MRNGRFLEVFLLVVGLLGCGGSLNGQGGPDGSTTTPCSAMGACACMAASDRCSPRVEACWCPTECAPNIECFCGGGHFLACENRTITTTACADELARVQTMCAGMAFAGSIGTLCNVNPLCIAGCLDQLATVPSCSQIDCSFCQTCDCAGPTTPSAFRTCVTDCSYAY
jgi:hypothetical protein